MRRCREELEVSINTPLFTSFNLSSAVSVPTGSLLPLPDRTDAASDDQQTEDDNDNISLDSITDDDPAQDAIVRSLFMKHLVPPAVRHKETAPVMGLATIGPPSFNKSIRLDLKPSKLLKAPPQKGKKGCNTNPQRSNAVNVKMGLHIKKIQPPLPSTVSTKSGEAFTTATHSDYRFLGGSQATSSIPVFPNVPSKGSAAVVLQPFPSAFFLPSPSPPCDTNAHTDALIRADQQLHRIPSKPMRSDHLLSPIVIDKDKEERIIISPTLISPTSNISAPPSWSSALRRPTSHSSRGKKGVLSVEEEDDQLLVIAPIRIQSSRKKGGGGGGSTTPSPSPSKDVRGKPFDDEEDSFIESTAAASPSLAVPHPGGGNHLLSLPEVLAPPQLINPRTPEPFPSPPKPIPIPRLTIKSPPPSSKRRGATPPLTDKDPLSPVPSEEEATITENSKKSILQFTDSVTNTTHHRGSGNQYCIILFRSSPTSGTASKAKRCCLLHPNTSGPYRSPHTPHGHMQRVNTTSLFIDT